MLHLATSMEPARWGYSLRQMFTWEVAGATLEPCSLQALLASASLDCLALTPSHPASARAR